MVAPTRAPQARGVKCDLCKRILTLATWLDQTKLAKEVNEPQTVLKLIEQHNSTECPCIPKNIENLLIGSTHFEIHRLMAKHLDAIVHQRQYDTCIKNRKLAEVSASKNKNEIINDHSDTSQVSRFRVFLCNFERTIINQNGKHFHHLCRAIDFWRCAMEDQTNPFNAKLALRLGLAHHVIYACYLFKYHKVLHYQLITANLLLNIFQSIDGVTQYAILHANFLLIKTLIDCDQVDIAREQYKQVTKSHPVRDNSHYESILLQIVGCELDFIDLNSVHIPLEELVDSAKIKPDDKLQHYYARNLAMSTLIRYRCSRSVNDRDDCCVEFFHLFRYICAIIRRCYESSFDLVLAEKDSKKMNNQQNQLLDHSWIRFAICDFVYSTFDNLSTFFIRAGMPECLELLYNALNLISYRNSSIFWQARMIDIGVQLDLVCDKYRQAQEKLDVLSQLVIHIGEHTPFSSIIELEHRLLSLSALVVQKKLIESKKLDAMLHQVDNCKELLLKSIVDIKLFDIESDAINKVCGSLKSEAPLLLSRYFTNMSLRMIKLGVISCLNSGETNKALAYLGQIKNHRYDYFENQVILESVVQFIATKPDNRLIESIEQSTLFIKCDTEIGDITNHLSSLKVAGDVVSGSNSNPRSRLVFGHTQGARKLRRKCRSYEVAKRTLEEAPEVAVSNQLSAIELCEKLANLSDDVPRTIGKDIATSYLRNSEPNPHYLFYRKSHELLLSNALTEDDQDHDLILYHFIESSTSNTMRYRWMMQEEQRISTFEPSEPHYHETTEKLASRSQMRQLMSFCGSVVDRRNSLKSMTRNIPDTYRLLQIKYFYDEDNQREHLLCASFNKSNESIFFQVRRSLIADFDENPSIPVRFSAKIEESRKSLLKGNLRGRSEKRDEIERNIESILGDLESDWLGPFIILLSADIADPSYKKYIDSIASEITTQLMKGLACNSEHMLKMLLSNTPLLSQHDFCRLIELLFNCDDSIRSRGCYNAWLESIGSYMKEKGLRPDKIAMLHNLDKGQLGLILDDKMEQIPFESLPTIRKSGQGLFRIPSLRVFSLIARTHCLPVKIGPDSVAYILDPESNLKKTRDRFNGKLLTRSIWEGTIGTPPAPDILERWLTDKDLYIYIGHGAGSAYYKGLCKGRGLGSVAHIKSASIVMGCSSGRMVAEGPNLETFGVGWLFLLRGSPCYMGLLWDVTDNDIDRYLDELIDRWICWSTSSAKTSSVRPLTNISNQVRDECRLKRLVGSAPVIYGLPVWCKN